MSFPFLKLTTTTGDPTWVNMGRVQEIQAASTGGIPIGSRLLMNTVGAHILVMESPEEIVESFQQKNLRPQAWGMGGADESEGPNPDLSPANGG